MSALKSIKDFQTENQSENSLLELAKIVGGRAEDCSTNESYSTDGGCDSDNWVYLDTNNGRKLVSHELVLTP